MLAVFFSIVTLCDAGYACHDTPYWCFDASLSGMPKYAKTACRVFDDEKERLGDEGLPLRLGCMRHASIV